MDCPTYEPFAAWSHPIDIHYTTKGLQGMFHLIFNMSFKRCIPIYKLTGWPKFNFEVWHQDSFGRTEIYGYGTCHVPATPGFHEIECVTWRPIGSIKDQITSYFVGGGLQLKNPELAIANSESYRLKTVSMGKVHLRLNIILRNFDKYGVEF